MAKRHEDALMVQNACNLSGVARSLVTVIDAVREEGGDPRTDPAVILFMDKMFDMVGRPDFMAYGDAHKACAEACRETLDYERQVALGLQTDEHEELLGEYGRLKVRGSRFLAQVRAFADEQGEAVRKQLEEKLTQIAAYGRPWQDDGTRDWRTTLWPDGGFISGSRSFNFHAETQEGDGWKTALVGGLIWWDHDKRWTVHT